MKMDVGGSRFRRSFLLLIATLTLLSTTALMIGTDVDEADAADTWVIQSGKCGDDIEWTLDSTFTLTLSGSGYIPSYTEWGPYEPWSSYYQQIRKIVIEGDITQIDAYAFDNYDSLRTVEIRSEMLYIYTMAFMNCRLLENVILPECLEYISNDVFNNCTSLEYIEIPASVKKIDMYAFADCRSLNTVILNEGLESIGQYSFKGTAMSTISIPDSVVDIDVNAFSECRFSTVNIGKGLPNIDAFVNIDTIAEFNISSDNPYICDEDGIVYNTSKTHLMHVPSSIAIDDFIIPSSVLVIDRMAFSRCKNLESVVLPQNLIIIEDAAFYDCTSLSSVVFPQSLLTIGNNAFSGCISLSDVNLPDGITVLGVGAFENCVSLETVYLGKSIYNVSSCLFMNCKSLISVVIPDTVEVIGYGAFNGCIRLTEVDLGEGLMSIEREAFLGCASLIELSIPDSVRNLGDMVFFNCTSLTQVEMPDNLNSVGYNVFQMCVSLQSISIPDGLTYLRSGMFNGCTSLTSVELSQNLTTIESAVFLDCHSLRSVSMPDTVTSIGSSAFCSCYSLEYVDLSEGITSIESDTFTNCRSLTNISIPDSVIKIGSSAFSFCVSLESVDLPDSLIVMDTHVFRDCSMLKSISIPKGVTTIEDYTFYCCYGLKTVDLPDTLVKIGHLAFGSCYSLEHIDLPKSLKNLGSQAFESCYDLKTVEIPQGVTKVEYGLFQNCHNLTTVVLPEGVNEIKDHAFFYCTSLASFIMPDTVTKMGVNSLYHCPSIAVMYVSANLLTSKETWIDLQLLNSTYTEEYTDIDDIRGHWFSGSMDGRLLRDTFSVIFVVDGVFESSCATLIGQTVDVYTKVGHTIEWEPMDVEIVDGSFVMPAKSITFVGISTPLKYKVTMDPCGGTFDTMPEGWTNEQGLYTKYYDYGTFASDIQRELFNLHRVESKLIWGQSSHMVNEYGLYIYAGWEINRYNITWMHEDGSILEISTHEYGSIPWYSGMTPTKMSTETTVYVFSGWSPIVTEVTNHVAYNAVFVEETRYYTINVDIDGVITSLTSTYGEIPSLPDNPYKPSTESTVYTFAGWSQPVFPVDSDRTYTALFNESPRYYTIAWMNDDATSLISTSQVRYGDKPAYTGVEPVKEDSLLYKYTFIGWSPNIVEVTGDAIYCATYVQTIISEDKFNVTWKNHDGSILEIDIYVDFGTLPTYEGTTPTKDPSEQYTYTFSGWSPSINVVTSDVTYTAQFSETINRYTITWMNGDGMVSLDQNVPYGTIPEFTGPMPVKASDRQYTYTFSGWDKQLDPIRGDTVFDAVFERTLNKYGITWQNYDGSVIRVDQVEYGMLPTYGGDTPVKPSSIQYDYTFTGWSPGVSMVTGETSYMAMFEAVLKKYTITWKDEDGIVLAHSYNVSYGSTPLYPHADPIKDNTEQYRYTFTGWSPALEYVTSDATYTAVYSSDYMRYSVTWKDESGSILEYDPSVSYGSMPEYNGTTPVKGSDSEYRYLFAGWSPALTTVSGDAVYTAVYNSTVNTYTVTWVDGNGTALEIDNHVPYGTMPSYDSAVPTMAADNQYSYEFSGWSPSITAVTGDTIYAATYHKTVKTYTVTWMDADGNILEIDEKVSYGTVPVYNGPTPTKDPTDEYTFTFAGWTRPVVEVTSDVTYIASFTTGASTYTITWKNDSGVILDISYGVEYNSIPRYDGDIPTRLSDGRYEYRFSGWSPVLTPVTSDTTYTATFEAIGKLFTVRWVNWDGSILEVDNSIEYGATPVYDGDEPSRPSDVMHTYVFRGWSPDVSEVITDTTYTAVFSASTQMYSVNWYNDDGTLLMESRGLSADMIPSYNGPVPVKESTEMYTYRFVGWDKEIVSASQATEYSARFESSYRLYDITWRNDTGEILAITPTGYGSIPVYDGLEPTKPSDAHYRYAFNNWTPQPDVVTGEATYTAVYERSDVMYTISWIDYDGSILSIRHDARYGDDVVMPDIIPDRNPSSYYEYSFLRWSGYVEGMTVTSNHIFTAIYEEYQVLYPLTFIDYNGRSSTLMYKAGDTFVDVPDPYETAPAGCIAFWDAYSLDGSMENIVRLNCVSYLEYGYVTPMSGGMSRAAGDMLLAVIGVNDNIDQWYDHLGNHYYVEIPETTLDGRSISAISSISDSHLTNVKFGGNIRHVSDGAFRECVNLSSFTVFDSTYYRSVNGALLTASGESLVCLPSVGDVYHLPDTVRHICGSAISGKLHVLYIDGNGGNISIEEGANVSGNYIELRPTIMTTELSMQALPINNVAHVMEITPHDMYGDKSGSNVYVILAIAILAVLIEMVAVYRPAILKNRHVWAFFGMVTVCATAMFVYTAVETVSMDVDGYFNVTLLIWLVSMVFGFAATFTTYIMGNKNRNVTALGSRGRKLVQISTIVSIVGASMLLVASVTDIVRVSGEWSTVLTILSSTVLVANVLSLVASKKIFAEVVLEQRRMDGKE